MFKRARLILLVLVASGLATGCGSTDHSWRGEFDARLEGATAAMQETLAKTSPTMSEIELDKSFYLLGRKLLFKSELIEKLDPPSGCETVQEGGENTVYGAARFGGELIKNLTPYLQRNVPKDVREQIARLKRLEGKSKTCA